MIVLAGPMLAAAAMLATTLTAAEIKWKPVENTLLSRFAKDAVPDSPLPEYPRP